jgi:L-alanine-DL-glutamate epimerase-like enolase superfamily enzyme
MQTDVPESSWVAVESRISSVDCRVVRVPLPRPVAWANVRIDAREYVVVTIDTADGMRGTGFTLGSRFANGARVIRSVVDEVFAPILVGRDVFETEALWEEMSFQALLLGRRGAVARALSAVDIALWDAMARSLGRPLCDLLGRYRTRVPAYASGGYHYSEDPAEDLASLEDEITRHVELGFRAVKVKIGRFSSAQDRRRIERVIEVAGPDVRVAVDANNKWRDAASAITALRPLDELNLWWIEEPVLPDQLQASARIAAALRTPIATGEMEAGRWAFAAILDARAASILQADVTVVGGISEWRKVCEMAACRDVALAPHWVPDIHVHLGAASPNVLALEYFDANVGVLNFDSLLQERLQVVDGEVLVPDRPGHGLLFDPEAIDHYTER